MNDVPISAVSTPEGFHALQLASSSAEPDAMAKLLALIPVLGRSAPGRKGILDPATPRSLTTASTASSSPTVRAMTSPALVACAGGAAGRRFARRTRQARAGLPRNRDRGPHQERPAALDDAGHGRQRRRSDRDPTKAWPEDRRSVEVGSLVVREIAAEADGPCRDINFDPTVLPNGIRTSDDPFPAARSAAYRVSYDRRTAEEKDYPRTATGAAQ